MKKIIFRKKFQTGLNVGFTLIELLVVVAIIGILASVVLAALNSARNKGTDGAIKGTLSNARPQAALFYDDNSQSYANVCINAGGISPMALNAAEKLNQASPSVGITTDNFVYDATGAVGSTVCHDSTSAWAMIASLKVPTTPNAGWCVDSTGAAKEATSLPANTYACP